MEAGNEILISWVLEANRQDGSRFYHLFLKFTVGMTGRGEVNRYEIASIA
jgi:hypothetical protein